MPSKRTRPELNEKQEAFCQMFVNGEKEMFGNGVQCYLEIYEIDKSKPNWYKTACSAASQLLSNIKVINRIRVLLEEGGFNDENIGKQHLFLINQFTDLGTKMRAISDFYKLKGKYAPVKTDITSDGEKIQAINMIIPDYGDNTKTDKEAISSLGSVEDKG